MINNITDLLIVKDNFFSDEIYKKIVHDISTLPFTNRSIDLSAKGNNSVYQKLYFHVPLDINHFAVTEVDRLLSNFGFDLKRCEHCYFLSAKHKEASPHDDSLVDLNCLIYIKGEELINSGTGFYDKKENEYVLNRHIGFKENRAIIFDSRISHASLQFNEGSEKRYIISNFFKYKDK